MGWSLRSGGQPALRYARMRDEVAPPSSARLRPVMIRPGGGCPMPTFDPLCTFSCCNGLTTVVSGNCSFTLAAVLLALAVKPKRKAAT